MNPEEERLTWPPQTASLWVAPHPSCTARIALATLR